MKSFSSTALAVTAVLSAPSEAIAQEANSEDWQFAGSLYLWGAGIDGKTTFGSDVSVSFGDIVENLDFALMGTLEAERGDWIIIGDLIYLKASTGQTSTRPVLPTLPGGGFTVDRTSSVRVESNVLQFLGGYQLAETPSTKIHGTFGLRYLEIDTTLGLEISGPLGSRSTNVSETEKTWDGVIGLRGRTALNEDWFLPYYVDIGAGQSKFTWQAFAGIGYDFGRSELVFGYRHLAWEFDNTTLISDIAFTGPGLQFRYRF